MPDGSKKRVVVSRSVSRSTIPWVLVGAWAAASTLLGPAPARASPQEATLKAKILLVALAYDRNLKARVGNSVTVGVAYRTDNQASTKAKAEMIQAFEALGTQTFLGLPLQIAELPIDNQENASGLVQQRGIDIIFISDNIGDKLDILLRLSHEEKTATMTTNADYVQRGVALGVVLQGATPRLLVNLPASKAAGLNLSAELMRIAKVIR